MADITAIVNIYKRPHTLDEQINAIRNQTIPPKQIFIWNNGNKSVDLTKYACDPYFVVFDNSFNSGVWTRFIIALLAKTTCVSVFDDDTIPGNRWFENCLNAMQEREALYGTIGVIFKDNDKYTILKRYGWDGNCDKSKYVDIVGHSWFFKRSWINYFLKEEPQIWKKISNGEDMHFAFMLQKYAHIPTMVPPHPVSDMSLWGSLPNTAWGYGCDGNSETGANYSLDCAFKECVDDGFRILINRNNVTSDDDLNYFLNKIRKNEPFALLRPTDRDKFIIDDLPISPIDGWNFIPGGRLNKDLDIAIKDAVVNNAYIGIPCPHCNISVYNWYMENYSIHPIFATFANIFINENWNKWIAFLKEEKLRINLFGPSNKECFLNVVKYHGLSEKLVDTWDRDADDTIKSVLEITDKTDGEIFFFSCGPIAKVLVSRAWASNKKNIYIDIGSSLDNELKGSTNRPYAHSVATSACKFGMFHV